MTQQSPLHELTTKAGAVFMEEAGWQMPAHFGDPLAEYRAARESAVLFDLSHHGKIEVAGPDAAKFLQNLSTNDLLTLPYGNVREAFLCTAKAKAIAFVFVRPIEVTKEPKRFLLDVGPGLAEKVLKHLDHHLISEQVELADRTSEYALLHLAGPRTSDLLHAKEMAGHLKKLEEKWGRPLPSGKIEALRHDRLGVMGYDSIFPHDSPEYWQVWFDAGVRPAGLEAYELLRVEAGLPVYGKDIDDERFVVEVNRGDRAICYTKGCYLGQEPIVMARDRGHVNRKLMGVVIDSARAVAAGTKLLAKGQDAGQVTSSVVSPRLGKAIALAYLRRGHEAPGTSLELESDGTLRTAEVVALPLGGSAGMGP